MTYNQNEISEARLYAWNLLKDYLKECIQENTDPCSEELLEQMNIWEAEYDKKCDQYYSAGRFQNG
jgi:hypothetical protein|tara:strand:+ start:792 stop:989 length:198 start_codon:yes stop_codon:yes gene_type:complete